MTHPKKFRPGLHSAAVKSARRNNYHFSGIGTLAFDARLGLYEDPPKQEALKFIEEVQNFLTLSHKLVFSITSRIAQQYGLDTPTFKKFVKCSYSMVHIGRGFVNKKMKELEEMAEKGIYPSANAQGRTQDV